MSPEAEGAIVVALRLFPSSLTVSMGTVSAWGGLERRWVMVAKIGAVEGLINADLFHLVEVHSQEVHFAGIRGSSSVSDDNCGFHRVREFEQKSMTAPLSEADVELPLSTKTPKSD